MGSNPTVKFALRAGTALKRSPLPSRWASQMNVPRLLSVLLLCLAVAKPALSYQVRDEEAPYGATQSEIKEALSNCQKNEMTIAVCEWSSYRHSVKELRSTRKEVEAALGSDKVRLSYFKQSQKAWEQFRNADCDLDASAADGGSMVAGLIYSCRTILTNQRVELLRQFVGTLNAGSPVPLLLYERQ